MKFREGSVHEKTKFKNEKEDQVFHFGVTKSSASAKVVRRVPPQNSALNLVHSWLEGSASSFLTSTPMLTTKPDLGTPAPIGLNVKRTLLGKNILVSLNYKK